MGTKNTTLLVIVLALIGGAIFYLQSQKPARVSNVTPIVVIDPTIETKSIGVVSGSQISADLAKATLDRRAEKAKKFSQAFELLNPTGFINTPLGGDGKSGPITIQSMIGKKVILLDIWTYSCINCQRTLPYLKSWYEKYEKDGFVIIGLHVPEFEFEKDYGNVLSAVQKFGIKYPVVLDSNASTAREYGMRYWPEEYLIDIDGFVVHKSIGEGGYAEKETKIQELLNERMKVLGMTGKISASVTAVDEEASPSPESPEIYFGSARNNNLGNGTAGKSGLQIFSLPETVNKNTLYLGGDWNILPEYAETKGSNTSIEFKYKAKEVYFVASAEQGVTVKIYQDGVLVSGNRGEDVSADGTVFIKEDRLYKLIKNPTKEEHTIQIEINSEGLDAYTFTFG